MSGESNRVIDVIPTESSTGSSASGGGTPSSLVNVGHAVYACFAIGFFVGFTWLVGVIIAYVKRDDARGTWMESHFSWVIRTFWWSIVWTIVGGILFVTIIGIPLAWAIWGIAWLWALYRVIKGWIRLNEARAVG